MSWPRAGTMSCRWGSGSGPDDHGWPRGTADVSDRSTGRLPPVPGLTRSDLEADAVGGGADVSVCASRVPNSVARTVAVTALQDVTLLIVVRPRARRRVWLRKGRYTSRRFSGRGFATGRVPVSLPGDLCRPGSGSLFTT